MDDCVFEDPMPADPCPLIARWLDYAHEHAVTTNWNTMMLATTGADGRPSARAVLHKDYDPKTGEFVFYTNYNSRKCQDIEYQPVVALCLHWDNIQRQIRVEGRAERVEPEVSDAYFATRNRESQIGAWASDQSERLSGWEDLLEKVIEYGMKFGNGPVPRPPHWGGYRVIPDRIEFWHGRDSRIHERVIYERDEAAESGWTFSWVAP